MNAQKIQDMKHNILRLMEENEKLEKSMSEAWALVNALAGQEHWERAEQWLEENKQFKPDGIS